MFRSAQNSLPSWLAARTSGLRCHPSYDGLQFGRGYSLSDAAGRDFRRADLRRLLDENIDHTIIVNTKSVVLRFGFHAIGCA